MSDWPSHYAHFSDLTTTSDSLELRPLRWEDREPIRRWRNEQIDVLRQSEPLTESDQDRYYEEVVRPQFDQPYPAQILWAAEEKGSLIGYGGIVHLVWSDRRGEVSFLTETSRSKASLAEDWAAFLEMIVPMARDLLGLHKLTTETYTTRHALVPVLEAQGFVLEGTLRQHHRINGAWVDSLAHGLLLG